MTIEQVSFQLILHAGNSKSFSMEGIKLAYENHFDEAAQKIEEANVELTIAHKSQYDLLSDYSSGKGVELDILLVHAQDHVTSAALMLDLAKEIINLNKKIYLAEQKGGEAK